MTGAEGPASDLGERLGRHLGEGARRRPLPSLDTGLAGIGGALAALAVVVVAAERWSKSGSTGASVAMTAVVLGLGMAGLARAEEPKGFRAAGAAAAGIAAPALAFYLVANSGSPSLRSFAFLAGVLLASLYLTGPWRGHPFHLSILAVAGWVFGMAMVDGAQGGIFGGGRSFESIGSAITEIGVASLVVGGLYLGAARWLDTQGLAGMATPLLGVSAVALVFGSQVVVRAADDVVGGLLGVAIGSALCLVGALAERRATLWAGLAAVAFGVLALVGALVGDDSIVLAALLVVAAGAGLIVVAPLVGAQLPGLPPDDGTPSPPAGELPPPRTFTL